MGQGEHGNKGKHVFIIGATGPVGRATALAFAAKGSSLVLHGGHDARTLNELSAECIAQGASKVSTLLLPCESVDSFAGSPLLPSSPDIVVHAWGPWKRASLAETSAVIWEEMALYNLALPGAIVSRYGPVMAEKGFGRLILFGSSSSDRIQSYRTIAAYAAAKTALGVVAKSAAREWGQRGVTCNVICPGYISFGREPAFSSDRVKVLDSSYQDADSVARTVIFFCEAVNSAVNGAILSCGEGI